MNSNPARMPACVKVENRLETAPHLDWRDMGGCDHFVQFYEKDSFLAESVGGFMAEALAAGEGAIIIATGEHRKLIAEEITRRGVDLLEAEKRGQWTSLDAADTLATFLVEGRPDRGRFNAHVGALIRNANKLWPGGVRAFGEMVALLWDDGHSEAALALEGLWNELAKDHAFALFCAYPMRAFRRPGDGALLAHICKTHTRVIPAESFSGNESWDERLRSITLLQQKASALDSEVASRRHAEVAAVADQTKLSLAVSAAELGLWEHDFVTRANLVSAQCKAHFGLTADEVLDHDRALSLVHPDDRDATHRAFEQAIAADGPYNIEFRVTRPNGDIRWIAAVGRIIRDGRHHILGITMDVTDRKAATAKLEQTVAIRTAQLRDSLAELEAFSYSVSHDMRAPLRAMQGYAKTLVEDYQSVLDPDAVDRLHRIQRASLRLDALVRDVLSYTKIAKGTLELGPISLDQAVADLINQYPEPERRCITLVQPLHRVLGHEACLDQCLGNLIGNALKFVARGETPNVIVRSELTGDSVKVSVRDHGIGIHTDHHGRIFQMFGRVHSEKNYEGTGMGLAIAKKAVSRMGGEIGFSSQVGGGSTFWFTLPHGKTND
jgi:PAS domain S-box-containing protein